jgi:hypothetical protein
MVNAMTGFNSKRDAAADKLQEPLIDRLRKTASKGVSVWGYLMLEAADALAQPAQMPVAWAVQGCSKMWRGEFAEIDAKAEAKRIGGTCVAYALYTAPPQREWVDALAQPAQEPDALTIAYQSGFYDGKKAALAGREWNFCERCGKRTADKVVIHTCTPPQEKNL